MIEVGKVFKAQIIFAFLLNVLFPWCWYKVFGFQYVYYQVDPIYLDYAFLLLTFSLLIAYFIPNLFKKKYVDISNSLMISPGIRKIFYLWVALRLIILIAFGGYEDIMAGAALGSVLNYLGMFLDIRLIYFLYLSYIFKKEKFGELLAASFVYMLISILGGSRAAIFIIVFFLFLFFIIFKPSSKFKKKLIWFIGFLAVLAPVSFYFATLKRGTSALSLKYLVNNIITRISYLEVSAIELEQWSRGSWIQSIFFEKYSFINQIQQGINSIVPGNIYSVDVHPNQYWRAIFSGYSVDMCKKYYMSMYSILPTYLTIKYGVGLNCIIYGGVVTLYYWCVNRFKNPMIVVFFAGYFSYLLFQFFDIAYHMQDVLYFVCTYFFIKFIIRGRSSRGKLIIKKRIKKRKTWR